jgi:hypothetical protein
LKSRILSASPSRVLIPLTPKQRSQAVIRAVEVEVGEVAEAAVAVEDKIFLRV